MTDGIYSPRQTFYAPVRSWSNGRVLAKYLHFMEAVQQASGDAIQVVAGIIWEQGRYLAVRRPAGKPMAGWWEFPGGKVESGESLDQALVRELHEELSITARNFSLWREARHRYPEFSVHLFFFWVASFHGRIQPRENQDLRWIVPGGETPRFLQADQGIVKELSHLDRVRV